MDMFDFHRWTVHNDIYFDFMMCQIYGVEWRWELSFKLQRMCAKQFNFSALYGISGQDLKNVLTRSN